MPGQAFFATAVLPGGLPGEEGLTPHAPSESGRSRYWPSALAPVQREALMPSFDKLLLRLQPEILKQLTAGWALGGMTAPGFNVGRVGVGRGQHQWIGVHAGFLQAYGPLVTALEGRILQALDQRIQRQALVIRALGSSGSHDSIVTWISWEARKLGGWDAWTLGCHETGRDQTCVSGPLDLFNLFDTVILQILHPQRTSLMST